MPAQYILTPERTVQPCSDLESWGRWFETSENRIVAQENIGDAQISTVFLGLDHNYSPDGPPILWETMIFWPDHKLDQEQDRCSGTWEQAEAMHQKMFKRVQKAQNRKAKK